MAGADRPIEFHSMCQNSSARYSAPSGPLLKLLGGSCFQSAGLGVVVLVAMTAAAVVVANKSAATSIIGHQLKPLPDSKGASWLSCETAAGGSAANGADMGAS